MNDKEIVQYLANILHVIYVDGTAKRVEERYINDVAKELGARASHIARAFEYYISGDYTLSFPFRYSDQLRNFEDMIRAAIADKKFEKVEQTLIKASYQRLGLSKDQLKRIYEEAKRTTKVVT